MKKTSFNFMFAVCVALWSGAWVKRQPYYYFT